MAYDISWIIPRLRNPGRLWLAASSITVAVVGLFSKLVIELLNKTTVYNRRALVAAVRARAPGVPLITYSNHHSCFDDPGLWGVLDVWTLVRGSRMRWSLAAHDICFTSALHAYFFALGKCVPVVRGAGVYQPAMELCAELVRRGEWVHIFPEGRVNADGAVARHKWGVARLVGAHPAPLVLPVWHQGMDRVLPNTEPYLLRFRRRVHLHVGEPLDLAALRRALAARGAGEDETRALITARLQEELLALRDRAHAMLREAGEADLVPPAPTTTTTTDSGDTASLDSGRGSDAEGERGAGEHTPPPHSPPANGHAHKDKDV